MPIRLTRRSLLAGLGAVGAALPLGLRAGGIELVAQPVAARILDRPTEGMRSYGPGLAPVLRLKQGEPAAIRFTNRMEEATTVHWHGLRVPHAMDGVAWVSQLPLGQGESFDYAFTPPDAGTFWYHPHCNTFDQLQRGLNGIVIVEEAEPPAFDADLPVLLRDFRLGPDGQFLHLSVARNAARAGTLGAVMTANWQVDPALPVPAGGLVRLRLVNSDVTRVHRLFLPGAQGVVLALDGHPLERPADLPVSAETALALAPGQRVDLGLLGADLAVMTDTKGGARRLMRLVAAGSGMRRGLEEMPRLAPNPLPVPDLDQAERLDFLFGWSPAGEAKGGSSLCGETGQRFWSINRIASGPDGPDPGAPLATLTRGRSYVLTFRNETQNDHPIHLHGLAFRLLRSDRRALVPHWTDTALLLAGETVEVALVADNPGDWVLHCHVIEHQKTGLSGFLRVT